MSWYRGKVSELSPEDLKTRREYHRRYNEQWRKDNADKCKEIMKKHDDKRKNKKKISDKIRRKAKRDEVINHYGAKCECCGENIHEFLAIDHKNGDGHLHRKEIGTSGSSIVEYILKNNFPDSFRILCHNCNMSIGMYGYCPHHPVIKIDGEIKNDWYGKHGTTKSIYNKLYRIKNRKKVLEHYGGKCDCCSESTYEFLAIDHINGNGKEDRKNGLLGDRMIQHLIKNDYPSGYRVLCHNCNMSYGHYDYCPHKKEELF